MNGAFYIGATGLRAQQSGVDLIANNIANMNTPAFKRASVSFAELVSAPSETTSSGRSAAASAAAAGGMFGVTFGAPQQVFTSGSFRQTDDPLDLAIRGNGFIELMGANGKTVLWKGGKLKINQDGFLATASGTQLKATISVPHDAEKLTVNENGKVFAKVAGQAEPQEIGQIDLVVPGDTRELKALGDGVYGVNENYTDLTRSTPGEDGSAAGTLAQGFSETSNVQLPDELVNLMMLQRAYAANARAVQAGDELMSIANGLKR
ncbi:flagellar hook-basal body protein [Paraherbaspirillum soli]|uniref:Flagellar hook-basal body protein n=1 Tax=Paraherbaspirillum soli TaxID=631222 RepID=A0ABW0MEU5_9BURK